MFPEREGVLLPRMVQREPDHHHVCFGAVVDGVGNAHQASQPAELPRVLNQVHGHRLSWVGMGRQVG